ALALKRSKVVIDEKVKGSLLQRATGFERKVQKATASGKVVTVVEYFPPDVRAQQLWLQARDPEFKPVQKHKHTLSADDAFLRFLEHLDDQGRAEREQKQLVDRANAVDVEPEPKSKPA